jgi:hypothetical protein
VIVKLWQQIGNILLDTYKMIKLRKENYPAIKTLVSAGKINLKTANTKFLTGKCEDESGKLTGRL